MHNNENALLRWIKGLAVAGVVFASLCALGVPKDRSATTAVAAAAVVIDPHYGGHAVMHQITHELAHRYHLDKTVNKWFGGEKPR